MKRRASIAGTIPERLLSFNPDDWLKRADLPAYDPADPDECSADETVRHYAHALVLFEDAQDAYVRAHPLLPIPDALIKARQDASMRFPDEPFDPSTV